MFSSTPRLLLWLALAVLVFRLLFALLAPTPLGLAAVQVAFLAFVSWKALTGSRKAALFLAILLLLGVGIDLFEFSRTPELPIEVVVVSAVWWTLLLATVAVIFFNTRVRQFYAERTSAGWRGEL